MTLKILFDHLKNGDSLEIFIRDLNTYLSSKGHSIEDTDEFGDTLLMDSALCDRLDILKILVERKANINAFNKGKTALTYSLCCLSNLLWSPAIAEFLLEQEDINVEIGKDKLFIFLMTTPQNKTKEKIYQSLIMKGVDIRPTLTEVSKIIYLLPPFQPFTKDYIKNALKKIYRCFYEAGRLMPSFDSECSIAKANQALMMHSVASGLTIAIDTKLDRMSSQIVAQYTYMDPELCYLFDRAFLEEIELIEGEVRPSRPPILVNAKRKSEALSQPQKNEPSNTSVNNPKKRK